MEFFNNKRILITGACGTIGTELIYKLLNTPQYQPAEIIGLDNNESALFFLDNQYTETENAHFYCTDVRDVDAIRRHMRGIDIVFHLAALKHVVLSERAPFDVVQTNIHGVQNIIQSAYDNHVKTVIFSSSDKAVNPTNVMGTSKLMGERLITAANSSQHSGGPVFSSTRFGNVLGSNGSVVPIFQKQIANGGPVTITDNNMTRFIMSIQQSVDLVLNSAQIAQGGEVFITKMPVIKIIDLAEAMIEELAPKYGYKPEDVTTIEIGSKPGEKLYEELMSQEETRRALELKRYFSVLPAFRNLYNNIDYRYPDIISDEVNNPYVSSEQPMLSKEEIKQLLNKYNILSPLE